MTYPVTESTIIHRCKRCDKDGLVQSGEYTPQWIECDHGLVKQSILKGQDGNFQLILDGDMFKTIEEIKRLNEKNEFGWFSDASMLKFNSEVASEIFKGSYFITSEHGGLGIKRYTVRMALENGDIVTVSRFKEFDDYIHAKKMINRL